VLLSPGSFGRPLIGGPDIPADRVKILREGFMKAMKDPDLLVAAEKRRWEPNRVSGAELQLLAAEVMGQPPEVIAKMKAVLETKPAGFSPAPCK
jgi:tripartite-type tricarboxylate transporter receptor subunit TctC